MHMRSFLLAAVIMLGLFLAGCGSSPVAQKQQSSPPAPSPPSTQDSDNLSAGNANNSESSSSGAADQADNTQIVQAVSSYVGDYYNDQSIKIDNSNTTIK